MRTKERLLSLCEEGGVNDKTAEAEDGNTLCLGVNLSLWDSCVTMATEEHLPSQCEEGGVVDKPAEAEAEDGNTRCLVV